jgi:lambda family phage portal protein
MGAMKLSRRIANAYRALTRGYDAASSSPRWPAWASQVAPARQALAARHTLASHAAYLVANSPSGESICEKWATNAVGDGPAVRSGHPDEATREALEAAFGDFYASADIDGTDLTGILNAAVRGLVSAGEAFFQLVTVERGALKVRQLSAEQIDPALNRELADGGYIVAGIEFDGAGRRVAYHVLPDLLSLTATLMRPAVRVPADDICHVFEKRFAGQVRGVSWLGAAQTRLVELHKLEDALLARMNCAALFAGFVTGEGTGGLDEKTALNPMEPGALFDLRGLGTTGVEFPSVPSIDGAPELLAHMTRSIASGTGLPAPIMASNYADTNYSSGTLGLGQFIRRIKAVQSSLLVGQFLQPLWNRFVTLEILSGRLSAPDFARDPAPYFAVSFLFPAWPSLNPLDEARADQITLAARLRSRQEIIAARGRDPAETDAEILADPFPLPQIQSQGGANVAA